MKNKRNKLQIKENWKKELTLNNSQLDLILGKGDDSMNPACTTLGCQDKEGKTGKSKDTRACTKA